jgi:acyl-CoA synthetase (AMP-forming)/AMP-acid ligase II
MTRQITSGISDRVSSHPDEVALRDERVSWTWAELHDSVCRATHALRALELPEPKRVAVYAENVAEVVIAHVAGLFAGVSIVPVNHHLNAFETAYILRDSGAAALLVGTSTLARGVEAAARAGVHTVVAWRSPHPEGVIGWGAWLGSADATPPPDDVVPRPPLIYTSGTTGFPKGVDFPPPMFARTRTVSDHVVASRTNRFAEYGLHLVVGPLSHTGPINGMRAVLQGVPLSVLGRFDAERTLQVIHEQRPETSLMVPTHFVRMLDLPDAVRNRYDVSSLRLVAHTGAVCPVDVKQRMIEWFGPVFVDAYGATEVGTICSITSEEWLAHPGSVGRVQPPFTRAFAVGEDDTELPPGEEGRLYFEDSTGRGVVYPRDAAKSAAANLRPGVFTIGEIGYVDEDGFVYLTDRFSDMIVSGGVNVYPAEAEAVLARHPKVADVAVIGVPDTDMGEQVKALVVPRDRHDPPDADELIALCRERLAAYKCPRSVDMVSTVGRTAMGKVNKRALRAPYWERGR